MRLLETNWHDLCRRIGQLNGQMAFDKMAYTVGLRIFQSIG